MALIVDNSNSIVTLCFKYLTASVPKYAQKLQEIVTEHDIPLLSIVQVTSADIKLELSRAMINFIDKNETDELKVEMNLQMSTLSVDFKVTSSSLSIGHSPLVLIDVSAFNDTGSIGSNKILVSTLLGDNKITELIQGEGGTVKKGKFVVGYSTRFDNKNILFVIFIA